MEETVEISVIVPAHNEEPNIEPVAAAVAGVLDPVALWEIVIVDDGSGDGTAAALRAMHARDRRIRYVSFSRNFGKEAAILAGILESRGRAVIVMDADLQHPPDILPRMIDLWRTGGCDVVDGVKRSRGRESLAYRAAAAMFGRMVSPAGGRDMRGSSDFKLIDRRVADIVAAFPERERFFRGLTEWAGFRHASILYDVAERHKGKTSWSVRGLVRYSLSNIVSFSSVPLRTISTLGMITILLSIALGIDTLYMKIAGKAVEGFTTVILSVAFFSGAILLCLGIMGEYLSRMYDEIKRRPTYIVAERSDSVTGTIGLDIREGHAPDA